MGKKLFVTDDGFGKFSVVKLSNKTTYLSAGTDQSQYLDFFSLPKK